MFAGLSHPLLVSEFIHILTNLCHRFALSVVTSVGYGKRVKTLQDEIVLENIEIDSCKSSPR